MIDISSGHLIEMIELNSGPSISSAKLSFHPTNVNVFIGPNHSGKSLLLREVQDSIQYPEHRPNWKILGNVLFKQWTDSQKAHIVTELRARSYPSPNNPLTNIEIKNGTAKIQLNKEHFEHLLSSIPEQVDVSQDDFLRSFLLHGSFLMLGGAERLNMLADSTRERPPGHECVHLLSKLFYSNEKRKRVQDIVFEAFRCYLVIDPLGTEFEAKISQNEPLGNVERSLDDNAVDYFGRAEKIADMSDGVRAFCGMIAAVVASDAKIILIDEPEAFLHPALCMKLARDLCQLARENGQQIFVSSHSAPFLMGCVHAGVDLSIIRLTYQNRNATSRLLQQDELVPLMRQPLLRSVGALTGIFYESVIVTESDSDRAFYDEINHRSLNSLHPSRIPDCLFLNAQNWQTTARIIGPLRRLGVAAAAIIDIDFLLQENSAPFQYLVESAGMPPSSRTAIGQLRGQLNVLLRPLATDLKKIGKGCIDGPPKLDLENFLRQLAEYGIFAVPGGELESWLKGIPREPWGGKNEWLLRTFEAMGEDAGSDNYVRPQSDDVWEFMDGIKKWLQDPSRNGMPSDWAVAR